MFCNYCGKKNPEESQFCMACGKRLGGEGSAPAANTQSGGETLSDYKSWFVTSWRAFVKSPSVLTLLICQTVLLILNFSQMESTLATLEQSLWMIGVRDLNLSGAAVFLQIPSILIAVGLWLQYADAWKGEPGLVKTAGIGLIKGGFIANIVVTGLALLMLFGSMSSVLDKSSNMFGYLFLGVTIGGGFGAYYYYLVLKLLSKTQDVLCLCEADTDHIKPLAVIQFVVGGLTALSLFSGGQIAWETLLSIGVSIWYGVVLMQYKEQMEMMQERKQKAYKTKPQPAPVSAPRPAEYQKVPAWTQVAVQTPPQSTSAAAAPVVQSGPAAAKSICSGCGKENTGGWTFCPNCGKRFVDTTE